MITQSSGKKYWMQQDEVTVVRYLQDYHDKWSLWNNSPFKQAWLRNFIAYYSPVINPSSWDTSLVFEGVQGELTRFYSPKARVLTRQLVTLVTKQRLSFQAMAETSGSDVIEDVKLANALADQIVQTERVDIKAEQLAEGALVCGNWFTKTIWRTDKGAKHTYDDNGRLLYKGGVEITTPSVFDTYYDITYPHWDLVPWVEVRTTKNRWELIAQFPELEKDILGIPSISEARGPNTWFERTLVDDDSIFVYEFFARPSAAVPKGRMTIYSDDKCIFFDGDNPYETLPVEPMTPEIVMTTQLGYPQFTNILAAQEMFDNSLSAIATNQSQFAVQSVSIPRGANVNVQELNGMRFVSFTPQNVPGGGKPEAMQLTQSSPETFKFTEVLDRLMQDLSNVNGALRGQPPPGVTSGIAIATLAANAIEFTASVSKSLQFCLEKTMFHAINAISKFAHIPQSLRVEGRNNQVSYKNYSKENVKNITGIKILTTNPLMQTIAGRIEIAEKLFSMPKEFWPKYVSVLEGRPLQEIYKCDLSQEDLIQSENDMLMQSQPVLALATDDHALHIQEHAGLLNDPVVRLNGKATQVITNHILKHKELAQTTDPFLLAMVRTGKIPEGGPPPPPPPNLPGPPQIGGVNAPNPIGQPEMRTAHPANDMLQRQGA